MTCGLGGQAGRHVSRKSFYVSTEVGDDARGRSSGSARRARPGPPALKLGFENFPMDQFGLLPDFPRHWQQ